ncbi:hypothetical protein QFZ72_003218 [Bacillus sp. V2I10]|nr:hypothetical protein [Bacillus sp. V2I10]
MTLPVGIHSSPRLGVALWGVTIICAVAADSIYVMLITTTVRYSNAVGRIFEYLSGG